MPVAPLQATAADGVVIRGEVDRGPTATWLLLLHDVGEDLDAWQPLRARLQPSGWSLLALDLRGHGGSHGEWSDDGAVLDCALGVRLAREAGAEHVAVVAAGRAAIAALRATARALASPDEPLADTLVLLSPGPVGDADPATLRGEGLATLVLYGALGEARQDARRILRLSVGWTLGVSFGTDQQGTALLRGPTLAHVADKLGAFVREQSVAGGPGRARTRRAGAHG